MKYRYDFSSTEFTEIENITDWKIAHNKYISSEENIFSNYLLFVNQFAPRHISAIHRTKMLNTINDSFTNWGIRIIALNTVSNISPQNQSGIGVDREELEKIMSYCLVEHRQDDIYTILVSHYSPNDLGYDSSDSEKQNMWAGMKPFLTQLNIRLWLCGHSHEASVRDIIIDESRTIKCSKSSTFRLSRNQLAPNAKRGYNVITLKKENGIISDIDISTNPL